jgi:kanamycin kinase/aminoglycoside 3'-phosphotransferase-3
MKYFVFGKGEKDFILVPGVGIRNNTLNADAIAEYYKPFHDEYKIYVFDIREELPNYYSIDEMMEDLYEAITSLGVKKAYFNGCSMGGMIVQRMEIKHPEVVIKAVLSSTVCKMSSQAQENVTVWRDLTASGDLKKLAECSCQQVYSKEYYDKYYDLLVDYHVGADKEDARRFIVQLNAILDFDNKEVAETKPDTLVITAKGDQTFSYTEAVEIAEKIGCEALVYEGYSHAVYDEAPDYLEKVKKFFENIEEIKLPENIKQLLSQKEYKADDIGMSKASVRVYDDCVLKIAKKSEKNDKTVEMMRWMQGKVPVPKILCYETDDKYQYLLMSKVPGKMSCDEQYLKQPQKLVELLADAMKLLWSVDVSDCPRNRTIDVELEEARYRVEHNMVDVDNVDPATFGEDGFKNPEELLHWLEDNRPDYEPVLSHGDFCLPNIFFDGEKISGFIDLGDAGIGDKWRDIALCYRSLRWNTEGVYGNVYPNEKELMLFEALGVEPNMEKLRYYLLLDELF